MKTKILLMLAAIFAGIVPARQATAQNLFSAYFMENATLRPSMNPALRTPKGYINVPVIGSTSVYVFSNSLNLESLLYPNPHGRGVVTFLDNSVDAGHFLCKLHGDNKLDGDVKIGILGAGFWIGKGFWTIDLNLNASVDANLPKEFFRFAKLGSGTEGASYAMRDLSAYMDAMAELGVGYSYQIDKRWTVGGRIKLLSGLARGNMHFSKFDIVMNGDQWEIDANGTLDISLPGVRYSTRDDSDNIDLKSLQARGGRMIGFGMGFDLGGEYKVSKKFTLSAALVNLGFMSWPAANTVSGNNRSEYIFEGFNIVNGVDQNKNNFDDLTNFSDLVRFEVTPSRHRTRRLAATVNIGAQYTLKEKHLTFGILSSTFIRPSATITEITFVANYHPTEWFSGSLSYSVVQSGVHAFGIAVNFIRNGPTFSSAPTSGRAASRGNSSRSASAPETSIWGWRYPSRTTGNGWIKKFFNVVPTLKI